MDIKLTGNVNINQGIKLSRNIKMKQGMRLSGNVNLASGDAFYLPWGRINGNIHEQTDLMNELELKVDKSSYLTNLEIEEIFRRHN